MLTKVFEGNINKCAQYWPEKVNETHKLDDGIIIRTKTEEVHCWYTKRQLLITKDDDSMSMAITHYQLTVWPDHGVPVDKIVMISFIDNIRLTHPPKGPPLVVHCSAGVGRTGTFIVIDTMLQRMKQENTLNIYDFLLQIRHQRITLVQTKEQYIYIHKSLADHIQCGETSFAIEKAQYRIKELRKKNEDEECEFQKEFELLKELSDTTSTISCSIAMDNQERNRFDYNLPYNHTRVILRDTENDYINASWVEGYKTGNWFIVTQIPLQNTQTDFWTMIHQQNCSVIVLLHPVGTDEIPQFWPPQMGQAKKYQDLTVEHSLEKEENDYQIITLELKFKNESAHNVTLYYYKKWNINTNNKPYLKPLFGILAKNQLENGNRPIVVACNDGVGCSGTFLTAYSQIERAKTEGVSDIFQFIRKARSQRPGLVDCL
uniref:protein-tyrosine-phosphatase n=1 Tax=Amphimedon queenslandica TaxID=400682 RepID=A0A1X7V1K4_AMPQE